MSAENGGPVLVILAAGRAKRYGGGLKPLAPVGPGGEAIMDLVASDARSAGFATFVLVVNDETGPVIRAHVESAWPEAVDVRFARQKAPRGTVDAVRAAWPEVDGRPRFAVSNADDLYGRDALALLADHLAGADGDQALVGFRLDRAVVGSSPVTRGVCRTDSSGRLVGIDERRGVARRPDGRFATSDGRSPEVLEGSTLVSMNLWAFSAAIGPELDAAMAGAAQNEVLLPELVGRLISTPEGRCRFSVLPTESRCIGVTHPDDLALVQEDVAEQVRRGERPSEAWSPR